jgi:hypothetical protein
VTADQPTRKAAVALWNTVATLNSKLAGLESAILRRTSTVRYSVSIEKPDPASPVRTLLKSDSDVQYLFAVNMEDSPVGVEFSFENGVDISSATVFDGSLHVDFDFNNEMIEDQLGGFDAKVYRIAFEPEDPSRGDTDGDGIPDDREFGQDHLCGLRDPFNPYDYYDVASAGGDPAVRDGVIDLSNDILGVILHYAPSGGGLYDANYDREPWQLGPGHWTCSGADGVIDLGNDILGVILQYNPNGCPISP